MTIYPSISIAYALMERDINLTIGIHRNISDGPIMNLSQCSAQAVLNAVIKHNGNLNSPGVTAGILISVLENFNIRQIYIVRVYMIVLHFPFKD